MSFVSFPRVLGRGSDWVIIPMNSFFDICMYGYGIGRNVLWNYGKAFERVFKNVSIIQLEVYPLHRLLI